VPTCTNLPSRPKSSFACHDHVAKQYLIPRRCSSKSVCASGWTMPQRSLRARESADATGTPEPNGLEPDFVVALIRRLGETIGILGGDVMEVAPPLRDKPDSTERTVGLAVRYLRETIGAVLRETV